MPSAPEDLASPVQIAFAVFRIDRSPAAALLRQMREELSELYEGLDIDGPSMPRAGAAELGPPGGLFIVGSRGEAPVCCGGVKRLPDGACELKRMFVIPSARREGIARELLIELEQQAMRLGYEVARLDTGPRQDPAKRLFESAGYEPIANFNCNPMASFFGEKQLIESSPR